MRDGRLLLVRRAIDPFRGWWDIPGGFCDEPEHPADAARREVREETGLDAEITGFIGMWLDAYPNPGDPEHPVTTLNSYFHAVATGSGSGAVDPSEATELGWFAPDALPAEIAFINHVGAVLDAWRTDVAGGRTVTPMPDRPAPA
jgi:ADP-ribose pyrophosphatase YjhB (NUDIX family)